MTTTTKTLQEQLVELRTNINNPVKNKKNPFFKSSYVDLNQTLEVIVEAMPKGLTFTQPINILDNGVEVLELVFMNDTEEKTVSRMPIFEPEASGKTNAMQVKGQEYTYYRRYQLTSYLGLGAEDNDGNEVKRSLPQQRKATPNKTASNPQQSASQFGEQERAMMIQDIKNRTTKLAEIRGEKPETLLAKLGDLTKANDSTLNAFHQQSGKALEREQPTK